MKTIKLIGTRRYEVELLLMDDGRYCVKYGNRRDEPKLSENLDDYKTAVLVFEAKVLELDGN